MKINVFFSKQERNVNDNRQFSPFLFVAKYFLADVIFVFTYSFAKKDVTRWHTNNE